MRKVAAFEAVVSGDICVLVPKHDRLLPELLPFCCLSERFFQHAVGTSAGSLSPRIHWSRIARYDKTDASFMAFILIGPLSCRNQL